MSAPKKITAKSVKSPAPATKPAPAAPVVKKAKATAEAVPAAKPAPAAAPAPVAKPPVAAVKPTVAPVAKPAEVPVTKAAPAPVAKPSPSPAPASKPAVVAIEKKPAVTTVAARVDVGFGNALFIRGEGAGLSWDRGVAMDCVGADLWQIILPESASVVTFKFLVNDLSWSTGPDYSAVGGSSVTLTPEF